MTERQNFGPEKHPDGADLAARTAPLRIDDRYPGLHVLPLIHRDSVLAETEHLCDTVAVDRPRTTQPRPVDEPSPNVDNRLPNVDEHGPIVDWRSHNILWLINGTER